MYIHLIPVIQGSLVIACIVLALWIVLIRLGKIRKLNIRDASLTSEELDVHAKKISLEHSVSKKKILLNWPVPRMNDNYDFILSVYKGLGEDIEKKRTVPPSAEWLLDNFYIIEEQVKVLRRELTKKSYLRLPVLRTGPFKGYARIFAIAAELVAHTDGQVNETILTDYLKAYQSHNVLLDREIWAVPMVMRLALIESVRPLCENIKNTQMEWRKADEIYGEWMKNEIQDAGKASKAIIDSLKTMGEIKPSFIEHLYYRLRRSGRSCVPVLRTMDNALARRGVNIEQITRKEHDARSVNTVSMGNSITSLRYFGTLDFEDFFESASFVEQILKQDPDRTYPKMDLSSRNYYRSRIEEMAAVYGVSEIHIAREVLELAKQAYLDDGGESMDMSVRRKWHVGYYLIGDGMKNLGGRQEEVKHPLINKLGVDNKFLRRLYIGSIILITLVFAALAIWYSMITSAHHTFLLSILGGFVVLIPASEVTVNLVNWIICKALRPAFFPRMELKSGIPEEWSTIVVIPTLLPDVGRVKELLKNLEEHYLTNREEHLYFVLIGAFRDSDTAVMNDDKEIIDDAMCRIQELNQKYARPGRDKFYFCHRKRQFNEKNSKWIGWERKRGALMEFNDLLLGADDTSFEYLSCKEMSSLNIQYIITLDSDTVLPMGMAKKMVGAMAHPLNRPVIDKKRNIVTTGYGIMQPRVDVDIESSNRSFFSRVFTGQGGRDPYANAISDVYQDLFGEGIFTGKGIYDVKAFQAVLKDAIPENRILSHDLLEGSYVRTALVSDLKLIDAFPSRYNSFSSRQHRWVRGDWQLLPLLFTRIFDHSQNKIANPLSLLSKWKIFDNLRKSLVAPSLMILLVLSFSILPGSIAFWLGIFFISTQSQLLIAILKFLLPPWFQKRKMKRHIPQIIGLKAAFLQGLLTFIFLPYQAMLMVHAVFVTLVRIFITKKNLLQWVTSADVEKTQKNSLQSYVLKMSVSFWAALAVFTLAIVFKPEAAAVSLVFLCLWAGAPFVAYFISKDRKEKEPDVSAQECARLGKIARKTWRYFEEFVSVKTNYLAPDNYQEDPPRGLAHRTSPTNIGLGLLSTLSARDLGYIGTYELVDLIDKTISTVEGLIKWNGHLYNWYDTRTLKALRPGYISTVDSGNLAGYLITLEQGLTGYLHSPLTDAGFLSGIMDTLSCAGQEDSEDYQNITALSVLYGREPMDVVLWNQILNKLSDGEAFSTIKITVWKTKINRMMMLFKREITELMPYADLLENVPGELCEGNTEEFSDDFKELLNLLRKNNTIFDMPAVYADAAHCISRMIEERKKIETTKNSKPLLYLHQLEESLNKAIDAAGSFIFKFEMLIHRVRALSEAMVFTPFYVKKKQLFSIGYNVEDNELTNSYYDLLASEARQTSYISIARGEIPESHWFKMGRALTAVDGYKGLISWTGTMFEYLMPLLIMKNYKNTLLDETYSFAIKSQKKYGRQRDMPWGTSESGFHSLDINHDYQYKAIGVPWLGLKRGLIEDAVVSPYSTFLALAVDPEGVVQNINRLEKEGLEGSYGFYESADYTPERLLFQQNRAIVKSYMAHHQGMSLLSLNNFLNENIMQERFHSDPEMHAARFLLSEKVPSNLLFTKENKEKIMPLKQEAFNERSPVRSFYLPDPMLPKAHILSNGNYSIMVTDRGTGYSSTKMMNVTRWREDSTLDPYGMFFYLRNVDTNTIWSAAYSPLNIMPDQYEVVFTADKATFKRLDGQIETKTEVAIASGDNVEFRRISLKNLGRKPCVLEVTSYFEVVLASQSADVAHPAFGNLFVETEFQADKKWAIANRRPRSDNDKGIWVGNAVVPGGDTIGDVQFETDRMHFLGRGNTAKAPAVMESGRLLSNSAGSVLDPVMSLRVSVQIDPGKTVTVSYVTAIGQTNEALFLLLDKYASPDAVERAFQLALARSRVETTYLGLRASEIELYQNMLSDILFISPIRRGNLALVQENSRGQDALWQHGISGDLPIVLVILKKTDQVEILFEVLKAYEYWRLLGLKVDLVIVNDEEFSYENPLHALILDIVSLRQTHFASNWPGKIFVLNKNDLQEEDVHLLRAAARIVLMGDAGSMEDQMIRPVSKSASSLKAFTGKPAEFAMPVAEQLHLQYFNDLGGFCLDGSEYVIRLEKGKNTPAPWVNVIANPKFGFIASDSGSGYTWHENSRENKLTPWSNDAVSDGPGEVIYIRDEDSGACFTVTALPIRDDKPYTVRHGFGYSVYEHTSHGIVQKLTQYVPVNEAVKVNIISLKNSSEQERNLTVTYYVRPVLGVSDQVTAMYIKTSAAPSGALLMENPYHREFAGNIYFMDVSLAERCITGDRREFLGAGDMGSPKSLLREELSGATGSGFDPCGAIQIKVSLNSNESRDIVFLLGAAANIQEVNDITRRYGKINTAWESLIEVKKFWKDKLNTVGVDTPSVSMNLILGGWLQYQVISCRLWARSGFYQSGGAYGFRDQLQDCLSIAPLWPEIAREQILHHAKHQFLEGDVQHWWHEPEGNGVRTRFTDDRLWLPYVTAEYIRITGDSEILMQQLSFLEDAPLSEFEEERYSKPNISEVKSSLYDHCIRAVEISLQFGSHGLPLMGTGDWNDGMNTVGNKGMGESVWLGWFLAAVLEMMSPVCIKTGDLERAERYLETRKKILAAIEENAWDGNWYRRAYFDDGTPLGSLENYECKIDSIAQTWAVISGGGDPQRARMAMNSLADNLVQWEDGLIKLLTPPFDDGEAEPGYIKGYVPGVRENGGQYTHAAAWAIIAFAKLGDGDKAWELFRLINPIKHTGSYTEYSRYKLEPYVMAADVYATDPHKGRGGWSWYTGSAGWMYRAGLEYILGFQKNGDTVIMDPCIPKKWREYTMKYKFRDTVYDIKVENPQGRCKGVESITLDGEVSAGNRIQLVNDGKCHEVMVSMGV